MSLSENLPAGVPDVRGESVSGTSVPKAGTVNRAAAVPRRRSIHSADPKLERTISHMQILFAQGGVTELFPWPPNTLWEAALACVVFGLIGIGLAVLGFKIFDLVTPGNLEEEIVKKNNMAAAIITGAFIIGVCIIIARVVGS
jgi:hypothetical protein